MRSRTFTAADQITFAEISGDNNPLHLDAVSARRLLFGAPVVHGIHALLWGLDLCLQEFAGTLEIRNIRAVFTKPIVVGDEVRLLQEDLGDGRVRMKLMSRGGTAITATIQLVETTRRTLSTCKPGFPALIEPRALSDDEIESDFGALELFLDTAAATKMFPHLIRCVSTMPVAVLLSTTRLVGVQCPGLHSIFSEVELSTTDPKETAELQYEVTKFDNRFGLVHIGLTAPEMVGSIKAFRRPAPQEQASFRTLIDHVHSDEFSGQRALVIGGSRGLGEVAAKLLSGGGADVKITHHQGKDDARSIVHEIVSNGEAADSFYFDVLNPVLKSSDISTNGWMPTHLYYFATPFISAGNGVFSYELFSKFCDYYVAGLINTWIQLEDFVISGVFYPSTVFIDDLPEKMGEYVAAKAAGEAMCKFLKTKTKGTTFYKPRLPRMATDQTVGIMPIAVDDPAKIMIRELRTMRDLSNSGGADGKDQL